MPLFSIRLVQVRRLALVTASQTSSVSPTASQTPSQTPSVTFTAARLWMISLFAGNYTPGYGGDGGQQEKARYRTDRSTATVDTSPQDPPPAHSSTDLAWDALTAPEDS